MYFIHNFFYPQPFSFQPILSQFCPKKRFRPLILTQSTKNSPDPQNYGHIQQQQLQQHHMERLQQLESLGQRIQNARAFLQQPNKASTNTDQQKLETLQQRIQNSRALLQQQQSSSEAASSGNLQFENLKLRIQNARARLQQPSLTSTSAGQKHLNLTSGPVISKEMFKNLQNATFAKNSTQQSPSKCLMTPRAPATTAVTMPFCTVQASNSKSKFFFISLFSVNYLLVNIYKKFFFCNLFIAVIFAPVKGLHDKDLRLLNAF